MPRGGGSVVGGPLRGNSMRSGTPRAMAQ